MAGQSPLGEVYIEYVVQGGLLKATAIHAATGTEVSIFGPVSTPRTVLARNAAAKLAYVLGKGSPK